MGKILRDGDGRPGSYDRFKTFEGRQYTGMKVGGKHHWTYDAGDWQETKVTPDRWEFTFAVNKRRKGHAPPGSGVPVGTEYHWYLLAHQTVKKLDANTYSTEMSGSKFKLAHKRSGKQSWSGNDRAQKKALIKILRSVIAELEREPDPAKAPDEDQAPKKVPRRKSAAVR